MIGLRDRYTTRLRGEAWLLFGDALASAATILFVSGAFGAGRSFEDRVLVALWAVIPCALGRALDPLLAQSRNVGRNIVIAALVGATLLALVAIGLTLIETTAAEGLTRFARPWCLLAIILGWGSGFLLFLPRVYLLHDLFVGGLLLLGFALGREGSAPAVGLTFLGLGISAAVRHQLHDVFAEIRSPRVNLHNARRFALALAVVAAGAFLSARFAANQLFPHVGLGPEPGEMIPVIVGEPNSGGEGGRESGESSVARARRTEREGRRGPDSSTIPSNDRIGFSRRVQLGALARPQQDPRVVFIAREFDLSAEPERVLRPSLRGNALWRGLTLSDFDALSESWGEEPMLARQERWPEEDALVYEEPAPEGPESILEIEIVETVVPTLPTPYFPRFLIPPEGAGSTFRQNLAGDLFPDEALKPGVRYGVRLSLHPRNRDAWPDAPVRGSHHDDRYLEIPDPDDLGFDIELHALPIFLGAETVQEKIGRLRAHFAESFEYDLEAYWVPVTGRLREFCLRERVGNCEYFATAAAMLLRTAGVSTRVVAGFLGWEWSRDRAHYLVRNGHAHLWTEVYFPGHGWRPLDATGWVPSRTIDEERSRIGDGDLVSGRGEGPGPEGDRGPGEAPEGSDPTGETPDPEGDPELEGTDPETRDDPRTPEDEDRGERATRRSERAVSWIENVRPGESRDRSRRRREGRREAWDPDDPALDPEIESFTGALGAETRQAARGLLLGIGLAVFGMLAIGFLRPRRDEEETTEEEDDPARPRGGIPDPLAGLLDFPDDFTPRNEREAVLHIYHELQRDLAERRRHRRPAETPLEHGQRVAERFPDLDPPFAALCEIVYRALYANSAIQHAEVEQVRSLARKIRRTAGGR